MAGVQLGFSEGIAKTPFLAEIDPNRCDYCGACLKTCNVKGIGLAPAARQSPKYARFAAVDAAVCLGCGACIPVCEQGAIHLVERPQRPRPPKTRGRLFARILWEKGRLWPFVMDRLKRRWR
ncbi:ATP-binding protein [Thiocystis minor]|uniref:ATP-binding protein n=1 Tax=Thiocystis minor TaxID=61597 RepID=UPI001F5C492A|nr:4Fe-4S dicluster domain-containing protein [Thiocystis minor]